MSDWANDWLVPNWPAPAKVNACVTTRAGGVSRAPFDTFNLGDHVRDDPDAVKENRARLTAALACKPAWLSQVHSTTVVRADLTQCDVADASWTAALQVACVVLTADCLPVLFCNRSGTRVAAAHAGWRGLAGGMLEATAAAIDSPGDPLMAWLGPAIGPEAFEVGAEVRDAFVSRDASSAVAFTASHNASRYMADLYQLARLRLAGCGVTEVYGGGLCTFNDPRFYSYRRAAMTGRFASLIWLD